MRMMVPALGRGQLLLHHRPAVFVPHDLIVGHPVTLADRALRKILVSLVMRPGPMGFRVVTRPVMGAVAGV